MSSRRIDIDLLRAMAVLSVIFFHFEVPGFDGGFLGVDIFFVISGYLITLHVQEQLSESRFSFLYFYLRRIRRLFPALIATLVLSSICAVVILPKLLLGDYSSSQIASSFYVSNIHFWSIANYFDTESILKPLLHTWSLSVEEQFYLVWPLFLLLTFSRKPKLGIVFVAVISLVAVEFVYDISPSAAFYLFPFRVFEFSIGALICGISLDGISKSLKNILLVFGFLSVFFTIVFFTDQAQNPGVLTLPLCLGTAIIIALRHPWTNINNIPTSVLLRIGLVSYSAYLVHWPLLVFYKIYNPQPLSLTATISLLAATYILAESIYNFIEKPTSKINLRNKKSLLIFLVPLVICLSLAFDILQPIIYRNINSNEAAVQYTLDRVSERKLVLEQINKEIEQSIALENLKKQRKIVVLGDSHAVDVSLALKLLLANTNIEVELMHSICDPLTLDSISVSLDELYKNAPQNKLRNPEYCEHYHANFLNSLVSLSPDLIIFSEAWRHSALPFLAKTIKEIKEFSSARVLVLGRNPQLSSSPNIIFKNLNNLDEINRVAWARRYKAFDDIDSVLKDTVSVTSIYFISKNQLICPNGKCNMLIGSELGYLDAQHWSLVGMKYYGDLLVKHESFKAATDW